MISFRNPDFVPKSWQFFLCFVAVITITGVVNVFATRALHTIDKVGMFWSMASVVICFVTVLACASPTFQSAEFVFTQVDNVSPPRGMQHVLTRPQEVGWGSFVTFMLSLVQAAFGLTGCELFHRAAVLS
jgi:choline transport protein